MVTDDEVKALQDEAETARLELAGLKAEKEALTRELESRDAAVTELEQIVASKDSEVVTLKQAMVESDEKFTDINNALAQAVASYKALAVKTNPGVFAELIAGDTIDAVNESLENAKAIIDRVRQGMEEEASRAKVPAGAPQRTPLDLSALSPREKIQYAIGGKR